MALFDRCIPRSLLSDGGWFEGFRDLPNDQPKGILVIVKTATVEEFTAHVAEYLGRVEAGEEVTLSREGRLVARVSPALPSEPVKGPASKPDIMARLAAQYGERCMSAEGAAAILDGVRSRE